MMNEMSFHEISYIFCDFQLERYRPTDQPTNQPTDRASYRGAMAHLKKPKSPKKAVTDQLTNRPTDIANCIVACTRQKTIKSVAQWQYCSATAVALLCLIVKLSEGRKGRGPKEDEVL